MSDARESEATDWIVARRRAGRSLADIPARLKPAAEESGYRIQQQVLAALAAAGGGARVGWKIGVTTPQMRAHIGIDAPIAGAMLAGGRRAPGAALRHADYCRLGIECEIAMVLAETLGGGVDAGAAARAVGAIHPAIELVDDRYGGDYRGFGAPALIADAAFHAGFVLGPAVPDWRRLDLGAVRGVTRANGTVRHHGMGADVQGHPMNSLAWLANRLAALGLGLEAGDIVMTGSLPVPYWAAPGDAIEIEIEQLGSVAITLA